MIAATAGSAGSAGSAGRGAAGGPTGPAGPAGSTGRECNCPCADCPGCPDVALVGCDAVKSPYFINVCCDCGPAINQPCICQPNTRNDGIRIAIEDVGTCVLGTVVLVTGSSIDTTYFLYQIEELAARGYRVIAMTLRGNGDGDQPRGPYSYDVWADDLRQVLDCLGVDDVTLVGHSAGSGTVLHYVARHQSCRVGRIVLASTEWLDTNGAGYPVTLAAANVLLAMMRIDYPAAIEGLIEATFAPQIPTPATFQYVVRSALKTRLYAAIEQVTYEAITAPAGNVLLNDLPSVTVPTLILHGVLDVIAPFEIALQLAAGIPGSELVPFPASGHNLMLSFEPGFIGPGQKFTEEVAAFASQGTCAMCPPDPNAPAPTLRAPTPTPARAILDLASLPTARRIIGWTLDGPVYEP